MERFKAREADDVGIARYPAAIPAYRGTNRVYEAQKELLEDGYLKSEADCDGCVGRGTLSAIEAWEQDKGIDFYTREELPDQREEQSISASDVGSFEALFGDEGVAVEISGLPNIKQFGWKDPEPDFVPEDKDGALMVTDKTWSAVGCLATNHCVLASYLLGRTVEPPEMAVWFRHNEGFTDAQGKPGGNLFNSAKFNDFLQSLGYEDKLPAYPVREDCKGVDNPEAIAAICKLIDEGTPVILHVSHDKSDRPRHFVIAYRYEIKDGRAIITFVEPGYGDHRGNTTEKNAANYGICEYRYWKTEEAQAV